MNDKNLKKDDTKSKSRDTEDLSPDFVRQLGEEIEQAEDKNNQIQKKADKEIVKIVQDVNKAMVKLVKDSE
jgi:hypothetical protein